MSGKTQKSLPVVWQVSVLPLINDRTLITGVILNKVPYDASKKTGKFGNFINILKTFFTTSYAGKKISINSKGINTNTETDASGGFWTVLDSKLEGELEITIPNNIEPLRIIQDYPVVHKNSNSKFGIISDIDDTIIDSFAVSFFKRIATLMFTTPEKRNPIKFTNGLYKSYGKEKTKIYYVSKSESNLFGMLTNFIVHSGFPKGILFLTRYVNLWGLVINKKPVDFKIDKIRFLIQNTPEKKFILFGDDGQRDMEIYSEIVKAFPESILKIYIRQTESKLNLSIQRQLEKIRKDAVPVKYFKSDDDIEESDKMPIDNS
jgi:phosphatidate phosphatase APP1